MPETSTPVRIALSQGTHAQQIYEVPADAVFLANGSRRMHDRERAGCVHWDSAQFAIDPNSTRPVHGAHHAHHPERMRAYWGERRDAETSLEVWLRCLDLGSGIEVTAATGRKSAKLPMQGVDESDATSGTCGEPGPRYSNSTSSAAARQPWASVTRFRIRLRAGPSVDSATFALVL